MKKVLVIASFVLGMSQLHARDTFDGCGIGWEIYPKKSVLGTTIRATTNNFVPPTFGMTSGTLGCDRFEGFVSDEKSNVEFIAKNYETIRSEIAIGQGEYLDAAAAVFGCDSFQFSNFVRSNYESVVTPAVDGVDFYNNVKSASGSVCS